MALTLLPDGSAVAQPSGKRPYPTGGGGGQKVPNVAAGGGRGATGKRVGVTTNQPGRGPVPKNNW